MKAAGQCFLPDAVPLVANCPVAALTWPSHAPVNVIGSAASPTLAMPLAVSFNVATSAAIDDALAALHADAIAVRHASAAHDAAHCP